MKKILYVVPAVVLVSGLGVAIMADTYFSPHDLQANILHVRQEKANAEVHLEVTDGGNEKIEVKDDFEEKTIKKEESHPKVEKKTVKTTQKVTAKPKKEDKTKEKVNTAASEEELVKDVIRRIRQEELTIEDKEDEKLGAESNEKAALQEDDESIDVQEESEVQEDEKASENEEAKEVSHENLSEAVH